MPNTIRIGTRGSELALWQTYHVKALLEAFFPGIAIDVQKIKTTGDKILDTPLAKIGDKGLFTKELEIALLDDRVDIAVHSFKDVPTLVPEGLTITAVLEREDVRSIIATGSLRRKCQLLNAHPDIQIVEIRGNLNTRIKKLDSSEWDGMILAKAGVTRLGWAQRITDILPIDLMLPAVGQGALAIECRAGNQRVQEMLRPLHHHTTAAAVTAERALLRYLEGGCQIPIGAYGQIIKNEFRLDAVIGSLDGKRIVRGKKIGTIADAEKIGIDLAKELFNQGGREILKEIRQPS